MMLIEDEPGSERFFNLHKSVGIVVFALVLLRIVWRLTHTPAALPPGVPRMGGDGVVAGAKPAVCLHVPAADHRLHRRFLQRGGHPLLRAKLPRLVTADKDTAERFFGIHIVLAWTMVAIIVLHAAGGLKHLLLDKDGVFQRMWFR